MGFANHYHGLLFMMYNNNCIYFNHILNTVMWMHTVTVQVYIILPLLFLGDIFMKRLSHPILHVLLLRLVPFSTVQLSQLL